MRRTSKRSWTAVDTRGLGELDQVAGAADGRILVMAGGGGSASVDLHSWPSGAYLPVADEPATPRTVELVELPEAERDGFLAAIADSNVRREVTALLAAAEPESDFLETPAAELAAGWLPRAAMDHVAELLQMAPIRVYEIATFYTMFQLKPRGRYLLQVCTTTPCWLRGSDGVMKACREVSGVGPGEVSADGLFSTVEVECLGACVNAPVIQINDDFFEDLDETSTRRVLEALKRGETPACGPQIERQTSAPVGGRTTLRAGSTPASGS